MLGQLASNWCYKWWVEVSESEVAGFRREQLNREKESNFPIRNSRCSFHLHPPTDNGLYQVSSQSSTSVIWALSEQDTQVMGCTWPGHQAAGARSAAESLPHLQGGWAGTASLYVLPPRTSCGRFSVEAVSLFLGVCLAAGLWSRRGSPGCCCHVNNNNCFGFPI